MCVCVCEVYTYICMCVCYGGGGLQSSGPCRPRPPSVNWKRKLLSQRQRSNQGLVSKTKGTKFKSQPTKIVTVCEDHVEVWRAYICCEGHKSIQEDGAESSK